MGSINWIGVATLCKREIWRFFKVFNQTILAPVITTLLFLAIMVLALGGNHRVIGGLAFDRFVAPGLIMMAVVQNAFANTSSSLILSKIQGTIVDLLMPPFTGAEITFSLVMGGVVRGLSVGAAVTMAIYFFVPFSLHDVWLALFHVVAASTMMALIGVLTGIWSQSFDQVATITNFIITPLAFLSGTFYSIQALPDVWRQLCYFNPFFYMIDGFRYAMTGHADGHVGVGMAVMLTANVLLWALTQRLITKGYRLKN